MVNDERIPRPMRIGSLLRPIAFHPVLVDICDGSITAALMLSQILYWTPKTGLEAEGWFYKTQNQWFEELRLTRTQQDTARKTLRENGFISEDLKSCPAGTVKHFKANIEVIEEAVECLQVSCKRVCGNPATTLAGNLQRNKERETTTETTALDPQPILPKKKSVKTEFPEGLQPSETNKNIASELHVDLREEWPKFRDHARANGSKYVDWHAAANNWIRNSVKFSKIGQPKKEVPLHVGTW